MADRYAHLSPSSWTWPKEHVHYGRGYYRIRSDIKLATLFKHARFLGITYLVAGPIIGNRQLCGRTNSQCNVGHGQVGDRRSDLDPIVGFQLLHTPILRLWTQSYPLKPLETRATLPGQAPELVRVGCSGEMERERPPSYMKVLANETSPDGESAIVSRLSYAGF